MRLLRRKTAAAATVTRVYTAKGRRAHLMAAGLLLCPTSPGPGGWFKRADAEAENLPVCTYCAAALADLGGGPP